MKKVQLIIASFFLCFSVLAQKPATQDSSAKVILDRASAKLSQYSTITADFELQIDDRADNMHSKSKGSIQIKGNKYYLESPGTQVHFDGVTMWSYVTEINEVTITEPEADEGDFVDNPALIFTFYNRDFKYRLTGEVNLDKRWMYEIDLFPKKLDQPYSRIKIFVDKQTDMLHMVKTVGKDGIDYTIFITNTRFNTKILDTQFSFIPSKFKGIEIIDMRF